VLNISKQFSSDNIRDKSLTRKIPRYGRHTNRTAP